MSAQPLVKGGRHWTVFTPDGLEIWRTDWRLCQRPRGQRRIRREFRTGHSVWWDFGWAMHITYGRGGK